MTNFEDSIVHEAQYFVPLDILLDTQGRDVSIKNIRPSVRLSLKQTGSQRKNNYSIFLFRDFSRDIIRWHCIRDLGTLYMF